MQKGLNIPKIVLLKRKTAPKNRGERYIEDPV